jgi:hypothetical protein
MTLSPQIATLSSAQGIIHRDLLYPFRHELLQPIKALVSFQHHIKLYQYYS